MNATTTYAGDISRLTIGLETRVERFAEHTVISWPMSVGIARLVRLTGIDRELLSRDLTGGRIVLDIPNEIADN